MIIKLQKCLLMPLLIISFLSIVGCGILNPPHRDNGYLVSHYTSCGPEAVRDAVNKYFTKNNIIRPAYVITTKQISQGIQRDAPPFPFNRTGWIVMFDRKAANITWPSEVKTACQKFGIKLRPVSVKYLEEHPDEIYIILCHKKWSIYDYHWLVYPHYTGLDFYGDDTMIDTVYLLERIN